MKRSITLINLKILPAFIALCIFIMGTAESKSVEINEELVGNGNFDAGNVGFTSEYIYKPDLICEAGQYTVTNDIRKVRMNGNGKCKPFKYCHDHTTGTGNILVADGSFVKSIWKQRIDGIDRNGEYKFEFWATFVSDSSERTPSFIVQINGKDYPQMSLGADACNWHKFVVMWESGTANSAELSIITTPSSPYFYDFAIDDVSFKLYCALKATPSNDTSICIGNSATVSTKTLDGLPPFSYSWKDNFGNTYPSNSNLLSVTPDRTTVYTVRTLDANQCENIEDITVNVLPLPTPKISADKPLRLCDRETLTLTADGGTSFVWSTGETTPSIAVTRSGTYSVQVTNENGCISSAETTVEFVPLPMPAITTDKPTDICPCSKIRLTTNPGYSYLWSTGETTQSIETSLPGEYSVTISDALGCSASASVAVTVKEASESIHADTLRSAVGDEVTLGLHQTSETNMNDCGFTKFTASVRFNKSLMIPLPGNYTSTIEGGEQILEIGGNSLAELIAELKFLVVLGDAECTSIRIEKFTRDCPDVRTEIINGELCLVGICTDPTARLIRDTGILDMTQPLPNPASGLVEFTVNLIEQGRNEFTIVNSFGEVVARVFDRDLSAGAYPVRFDCSVLAQGTYFCILRTPTASVTRRLEVVR